MIVVHTLARRRRARTSSLSANASLRGNELPVAGARPGPVESLEKSLKNSEVQGTATGSAGVIASASALQLRGALAVALALPVADFEYTHERR